MKKIIIWLLVIAKLMICAAACAAPVCFTDALGREVSMDASQRIGAASGSLAECWMLAGGTVSAVTRDAFEERGLPLGKEVVDLGSLKDPSLEMILAHDIEFMMLMPSQKNHIAMAETLDRAGVGYAYFDIEVFEDYLELLRLFTGVTGRDDLYAANGEAILPRIRTAVEAAGEKAGAKVLVVRTSTAKIKALNSETMVGAMLRDMGLCNIADSQEMLLTELSLEVIVKEDPDYIFITCMGDMQAGIAQFEAAYGANPAWRRLSAVENGRCFYLEKELFHYKPNARWGESYERLAQLLLQD